MRERLAERRAAAARGHRLLPRALVGLILRLEVRGAPHHGSGQGADDEQQPEQQRRRPRDGGVRRVAHEHEPRDDVGGHGAGRLPKERPPHACASVLVRRRALARLRRRQWVDAAHADASEDAARADHAVHGAVGAPREEAGPERADDDEPQRQQQRAPPPDDVAQVPHPDHAHHRAGEHHAEQRLVRPGRLGEVGRVRRRHGAAGVVVGDLDAVVRLHDLQRDRGAREVVLHGEVRDGRDEVRLRRRRGRCGGLLFHRGCGGFAETVLQCSLFSVGESNTAAVQASAPFHLLFTP